jgi:cell division protein FtsZ
MRLAESGIERLQEHVDTLIIIPNQNLFRIATEKTTFAEAFGMADQVLHSGVRGITDLMVMPGLINLDFADVRTVMNEMGKAMMGTGESSGEKRAVEAAHNAINNPLLDDVSMKGAKGVLINITGGMDMTLYEVDEAANEIRNEVDPDANIIVGSTFDPELEGIIRVSVVATGIDAELNEMHDPRRRQGAEPVAPVWKGRETRPQRQAEPLVRRASDAVAVNETPRAEAPSAPQVTARGGDTVSAPDSFTGGQPVHPVAKPAVVETRERLEREMTHPAEPQAHMQHQQPVEVQPQQPVQQPKAEDSQPAREPRRGLSLFGRRKSAPVENKAPAQPERPSVVRPVESAPRPSQPSGDLFGEELDENELEIPAFLRRQAN